jgi:quinol monooxygenase YgiN
MVIVLGQFDVDPADVSQAAALMRAMPAATVREPGCLHYAFAADLLDPNRFQLSELWRDAASLEAHAQTPHMADFRAGLARLRVRERRVRRYAAGEAGEL